MTPMLAILVAVLVGSAGFLAAYYVSTRLVRELAAVKAAPRERRSDVPRSPFVAAWVRRVEPLVPTSLEGRIERRIVQAGGLEGLTPAELFLYVVITTLVGVALSIWIAMATGWTLWLVLAGVILGVVYPFVWLRDRVRLRHLEIQRELPFHIDLLTLCVEAGLDFAAGVAKTCEKGKPGALRDELTRFLGEVRVGKTRAEALEAMGARVGLMALTNFVSALVQAERMGSGVGKTLRAQAEQLRSERSQRAEKAAGEAPVKILIPLVLFVFPTIWIVLAAPLVFEWVFGGGLAP
ncbi:MAG: type II secretion system F family protein [Myxococcota bacterium]|nr:type II secretion system F family protein [Myxococcota bacterium]